MKSWFWNWWAKWNPSQTLKWISKTMMSFHFQRLCHSFLKIINYKTITLVFVTVGNFITFSYVILIELLLKYPKNRIQNILEYWTKKQIVFLDKFLYLLIELISKVLQMKIVSSVLCQFTLFFHGITVDVSSQSQIIWYHLDFNWIAHGPGWR